MSERTAMSETTVDVAIVGSGFAGLGAAVRLAQAGRGDFLVLEKGDSVGGTWRDNTYPGCACDVQSHLYSFSFAPNPDWTRRSPASPRSAPTSRASPTASGCATASASAREVTRRRVGRADAGRCRPPTAPSCARRVVIWGTGRAARSRPSPTSPGSTSSPARSSTPRAGTTTTTCAAGGSPSSAPARAPIQFVPRIQPEVGSLTLFQRTAPWVLPKPDRDDAAGCMRRIYRRFPAVQRAQRALIYARNESARRRLPQPRPDEGRREVRPRPTSTGSSPTAPTSRRSSRPTSRSAASGS